MRRILPLLILVAIACLPVPSRAQSPKLVLLACDTLSTNPLQVHFSYGLQNPSNGYEIVLYYLDSYDPAIHFLSCSTSAPGWACNSSPGRLR